MRLAAAVLAALLLLAGPALADRVFVSVSSEEQGHGWLFGSAWEGGLACWIAVPRHVVRERGGDRLLAFKFVTAAGRTGDTGTPFWIGDVPGAKEAAAGQDDLAFARVTSGVTDCPSRLGLPDYAYAGFIESIVELTGLSMSPASYGPFGLRIERASMAEGGGLLRLAARSAEEAERYMNGGISGAVVEAERNGAPVPVAMILKVDPATRIGLALRFDRLRAAFRLVEAAAKQAFRDELSSGDGLPVHIDEAAGLPLADSAGPSALLSGARCLRMKPPGGQRSVDLIVSLGIVEGATRGMALASGACAAPGARYSVEQRSDARAAWSVVKSCVVAAELPDAADCGFDLRAPRQFRIRVIGSPVELAGLRFY